MEQKLVSSLRSTLQTPASNWHACSKGSFVFVVFKGFFFPLLI